MWGTTGYDTPKHWCNNAYADLYAKWSRVGAGVPVSYNALGEGMCYSRDGVNCTADISRFGFDPKVPLVCGDLHKKIWGNTGYSEPGHWCNGIVRPFTLAITSDPQYPWRNEHDIPSSGNEIADSNQSIPLTYDSINRYHSNKSPIAGVVINGDVTAFGHGWQWDYMHRAFSKLSPPILMGLGNHDYENNLNDCAENNCIRNSLNALERYLPRDAKVDRKINYYYEFPTNYKEFKGSFAWSKTIGGVHFVFLNNEPTYSFQAGGYNAADARRERFIIESAIPWLDVDLANARAQGKPIVLVFHKPGEFADAAGRARFEGMVKKYKVSLIFWGHVHTLGTAAQGHRFGGAVAMFSGSASTQTYLISKFDPTAGFAEVYWSKRGNIDGMPLIERVPLVAPVEGLAPTPEQQPYKIRFVNNGGYIARFKLRYIDANGRESITETGDKVVGAGWEPTVPVGATGVVAQARGNTGLLWNLWPLIFSQQVTKAGCFKTYGTTLNMGWSGC
ncbi:metallophosphoesterase [Burkholderia sp. JSH-S8]|nr:metallophosphoesterase [Burkholderia sp. JSH-S8]